MAFTIEERAALLRIKGVGPNVLKRLEQLGYGSLDKLATAEAFFICKEAALLVGSSCWGNSPQARAAVQAAIDAAQRLRGSKDS